jgi:ribonuclease HII
LNLCTHPNPTIFIGIDEAGYGPNLGPLVVAATAFLADKTWQSLDWWKQLAPLVGRAGSTSSLIIDDSKKVLASSSGQLTLAHTAKAILAMTGQLSPSLEGLIRTLAPRDLVHFQNEHWSSPPSICRWPDSDEPLTDLLSDQHSLQPFPIAARVLFPSAFNERLQLSPTKADVEADLIRDLLDRQLQSIPSNITNIDITIDRLGGRRYYRDFLESCFENAWVLTRQETTQISQYAIDLPGRSINIRFVVKGDQHSLPVAAASMIAKFLREESMHQFNRFWQHLIPNLQATAGYPTDAKRFLADLGHHPQAKNITQHQLWRAK